MKKYLFGFIFLVLILLLTFVSAQSFFSNIDLRVGSERIVQLIQDLFEPFAYIVLGGSGEFLFERVLFLVIMVSFVYLVLSRISLFEDKSSIVWVVTIAVSLISTRFLTETQFVQNILLPYGVLGVVLTAVVPLIIFFFFVQSFDNMILRKFLWIFFIVVFIGLWFSRYNDLGDLVWIYMLTGLASLLFFLFDGSIRRATIKQQMAQLGYNRREDLARDIRRKIDEANIDARNGIITASQLNSIKRRLNKQLKAIMKN